MNRTCFWSSKSLFWFSFNSVTEHQSKLCNKEPCFYLFPNPTPSYNVGLLLLKVVVSNAFIISLSSTQNARMVSKWIHGCIIHQNKTCVKKWKWNLFLFIQVKNILSMSFHTNLKNKNKWKGIPSFEAGRTYYYWMNKLKMWDAQKTLYLWHK